MFTGNHNNADDAILLQKLKAGDSDAFDKLVALHQVQVLNICYRFLLQQQDAEDVAQEVFIEVYNSIHHFRGDARLTTWIHRIAVTKSLDEIKKRNRKKRISSFGKTLHIDQFIAKLSGNLQPDKSLEEKNNYETLLLLLNKLPDNQRIALTLSKLDGFSNPEIADIMQTTVIAVDSLLYRAKQNLKEIISKHHEN